MYLANLSQPIDHFGAVIGDMGAGRCSHPLPCLEVSDNEEELEEGFFQNWAPDITLVNPRPFHSLLDSFKCPAEMTVTQSLKELGDRPLYEGSDFLLQDFARFVFYMKACNASVGDRLFASIVGYIGAFLPKPNVLGEALGESPTMYSTLKLLHSAADVPDDLSSYKIDTCACGCLPFTGNIRMADRCPTCEGPRWKHCSRTCFDEWGSKLCKHANVPVRMLYYMPMRDRIEKLLLSDMHHLFHYEDYRHKCSNDDFVEDIFDSRTYKTFKDIIPRGDRLIFLQVNNDV